MQGDENICLKMDLRKENTMELCRIRGEFESVELAELAAGRVRRSVQGVQKAVVQQLGKALEGYTGRQRYTLLPANMRMYNYATAVMVSDISDDVLPEPAYRKSAELIVLCDAQTADRASAIMQAAGAVRMRKS